MSPKMKDYWKHRAKRLARHKQYRLANPEKIQVIKRRWRLANPDKVRLQKQRSYVVEEWLPFVGGYWNQ
jgi:hypothetical protein